MRAVGGPGKLIPILSRHLSSVGALIFSTWRKYSFLRFWKRSQLMIGCLSFTHLGIFQVFPLLFVLSFIPLLLQRTLCIISVFLNLLRLFGDLTNDLSWRMFHVHLRVMCILLLFCGVSWIYLIGLSGSSLLCPNWSSL